MVQRKKNNSPKILLIMPPYNFCLKNWGYLPWPPIAIAHLKDFLKKNKIKADLLDLDILIIKNKGALEQMVEIERGLREKSVENYLKTGQPDEITKRATNILIKFINWRAYDIFGFSIIERRNLKYSLILAKKIKESNKKAGVVFGGKVVNLALKFPLGGVADLVVRGSGEEKLLEFCKNYPKNLKKSSPEITSYIHKTNLTLAHKPNYNGILKFYKNIPQNFGFHNYYNNILVPYLYSYGCPWGKCSFCRSSAIPHFSKFFSQKPPLKIIDDLKWLKKSFNSPYIALLDQCVNAGPENFKKICQALTDSKLDLTISGSLRSDIPIQLIPLMKKAGFKIVYIGIESTSPRILKLINKGIDVKMAQNLVDKFQQNKIFLCAYFIVGFPTEKEKDFKKTFNFIQKNIEKLDYVFISLFRLEESIIRKEPEKFGIKLRARPPVTSSKYILTGYVLAYDEIKGRSWEELLLENQKNYYILNRLFYLYKEIPLPFYRSCLNETLFLMRKYNDHRKVQEELKKLYQNFKKRKSIFLRIAPRKKNSTPPFSFEEKWSKEIKNFSQAARIIRENAEQKEELVLTGNTASFPNLPGLIKMAKELGFRVRLFTTGEEFSSMAYAHQLSDMGLDSVTFSIFGHRAWLHNKIRKRREGFNLTLKGIKNWQKTGKELEVRPVILKENEKYLYQMLKIDEKFSEKTELVKAKEYYQYHL